MDIIMSYIDSMFAGVPVTDETKRLRDDITANMSDKFDELIKEGRSVNEAIGTVISEFGNIDEVLSEMGVERTPAQPAAVSDPARPLLRRVRIYSAAMGAGGLILLGAVLLSARIVWDQYDYAGFGIYGMISALTGIVILIAALVMRTNILMGSVGLPREITGTLRSIRAKSAKRDFMLNVISRSVELFAFVVCVFTDIAGYPGLTGVLFMMVTVSAVFALRTAMLCAERMYGRLIGEPPARPTVLRAVNFFAVPALSFAVTFTMFNIVYYAGYISGTTTLGCLFMVLFMTVLTIAEIVDLIIARNAAMYAAPQEDNSRNFPDVSGS